MMKTRGLVHLIVSLFAVTVLVGTSVAPALAQSGCAQASPENPSLILALLGGAVAAIPFVRARIKSSSDR